MYFVVSIDNLKLLKHDTFCKNISFFIICSKYENRDDKIHKEEESIETIKALDLITLKIWLKKT